MSDIKIYKINRKLFLDSPQITVPPYQRDYSWQSIQIQQLLSDIENVPLFKSGNKIEPKSLHFLGLLVFIDSKNSEDDSVYELVDGQQRLSTLSLVASAATDLISKIIQEEDLSNEKRDKLIKISKGFNEYISIEARPFGDKKQKLIPNKNDQKLYSILAEPDIGEVQKLKIIEEQLGRSFLKKKYVLAYKEIFTYFSESYSKSGYESLIDFFVKFDAGISFIPFVAESDTDAFNLFETLNDRGVNLSALDLIKNKVLQKATNSHTRVIFDEKWQMIFGKDGIIETSKSQFFLRVFLMLKNDHISHSQLYKTCKDMLDRGGDDETEKFLDELKTYAEIWQQVTEVISINDQSVIRHIKDDDLSEIIYLLNKTRVRQWNTIVIAIFKSYKDGFIDKANARELFNIVLKICIRFKILNKRFNIIEKKFPEIAKKINEIGSANDPQKVIILALEELQTILDKNVPSGELAVALDEGYQFEDNDLAFIILRKLLIDRVQHGLSFTPTYSLSLEHILPEKHETNWGKIQDVDEKKYSIGNMVLLSLNTNSQISNKGLADKQERYKDIKIFETVDQEGLRVSDFTDQKTWINIGIKDREKIIIKRVKELI